MITKGYCRPAQTGISPARFMAVVFVLLVILSACHDPWDTDDWLVLAEADQDFIVLTAKIADIHGDFIHMSIRKQGWDNHYTIEGSPAPQQPDRDWSRVHHWFGELHTNTFLEGRIDDGSGQGPGELQTFMFLLPRASAWERYNFPDENGSKYQYITQGYGYADGHWSHPAFEAGEYEIEIYAWYTGKANGDHPAADGKPEVQYIHYEHHVTSTTFTVE